MARVFKKCETRYAAVRVSFCSLLVQRDQWDTYWGPKKIIFLIRDIDGPAMTAASMEFCRFVARRSPGSRSRSVLVACNRLRRVRGRFHRWIHISTGPQPDIGLEHKSDNFSIQSSLGSPENRRMRSRGSLDLRPIPEGVREPICIRKK